MRASVVRFADKKYRVGVLGASGAVGSRFLNMLDKHPWFDVVAMGGGPGEVGYLVTEWSLRWCQTGVPQSGSTLP